LCYTDQLSAMWLHLVFLAQCYTAHLYLDSFPTRRSSDLKSKLYEHYGVREYWIVDPIEEMVSIQRLEDGVYVLLDGFGRDDTLRSPLLEGFELDLALIFPETPAAGDVHGEEFQSTDDNQ